MTFEVKTCIRARHAAAWMMGLACALIVLPASAANCPRPEALGTSRTLVVDPREHPLIGGMQYPESLPLSDGEVVLTFDDGPLPKYTYQVLDILAAQCVKATFFVVGRQAQANPEAVRKVLAAGHTIATHTQNHPFGMQRLPLDRATAEIDEGIASVTAALDGAGGAIAPFFRIPGLRRNDGIEEHARAKGLQVWSADFPADDWRPVSPKRVYDLAMQRLAAKGKGILLLHDIQPRTVAALPRILQDLKSRGYRIVHVVPATAENPATPTERQQWRLHPLSDPVASAPWSVVPNFVLVQHAMLPAPLVTDSYWNDIKLLDKAQTPGSSTPLPRPALWPRQLPLASINMASALPVPAPSVFDAAEGWRMMLRAMHASSPASHIASGALAKAAPGAARSGKRPPTEAGARGRNLAAGPPARQSRPHIQSGPGTPKGAGSDKKNVRHPHRNSQQASL